MIEKVPRQWHLMESQVIEMRMTQYKAYLVERCGFSHFHVRSFFWLLGTHREALRKTYALRLNPPKSLGLDQQEREEWEILRLMAAATVYGPQPDRLVKYLENKTE